MAEPHRGLSDRALEAALAALGGRLLVPEEPDLAARVADRLRSQPSPGRSPVGFPPGGRPAARALRPVIRPAGQRMMAAAAAVVFLVAGGVVALPGARHAVAGWLGLRGEHIRVVPLPPSPLPTGIGGTLDLGRRVTLPQAQARASFRILLPRVPELGSAREVYLGPRMYGGQVSLLFAPGPGFPATTAGAGLLITEFQAMIDSPFVEKFVGPGSTIESVRVGSEPGFWIAGRPHQILYRDANGNEVPDSIRLAGNVLAWQHGDVTLRIEGQISKAEALRIARSVS